MIDKNLYAVRNPLITTERIQPAFSVFLLHYNGIDYPVYLNDTAAEVMHLCDGTKRVSQIYTHLAQKYDQPEKEIEELLSDFWDMSSRCKHIVFTDTPAPYTKMKVFGSPDYWTPDLLSVELTHRCPLRCKHCFLSAGNGPMMTADTWAEILDSVLIMKIPQVQLTGGEPLLHPSFFDMADALLRNDITIHIFTSGVVYSDEIFARFKEYEKYKKKVNFQISLDGLAEYHDEFRGVKGSFDRSVHFIKTITAMGFKTIVGTTVHSQSFSELEQLCALCKEIGVSVMRIGGISNRGRAEENGIESHSQEIIDILDIKQKLSAKFADSTFKIQLNEDHNSQEKTYLLNCGLGQTSVKIGPEGDVFPCMMADMSYANINRISLLDIQKKYSRMFEKLVPPSKEMCAGCKDQLLCEKCIVEGCAHAKHISCRWHDENAASMNRCFKGA